MPGTGLVPLIMTFICHDHSCVMSLFSDSGDKTAGVKLGRLKKSLMMVELTTLINCKNSRCCFPAGDGCPTAHIPSFTTSGNKPTNKLKLRKSSFFSKMS